MICKYCGKDRKPYCYGRNVCRECNNELRRRRKRQVVPRRSSEKMQEQFAAGEITCPGCGQVKSVTEFGANKHRRGGKAAYCRPCASKRDAALRDKWLKAGKCASCGSKSGRVSGCTFCEKCWWKLKERNYHVPVAVLKSIYAAQGNRCAYTGDAIKPGKMWLEHRMPISRFPDMAQEEKNLCWVTGRVNRMKSDMTVEEFHDMCRKVIRYAESKTTSSETVGQAV